jgi:hypothetical protein
VTGVAAHEVFAEEAVDRAGDVARPLLGRLLAAEEVGRAHVEHARGACAHGGRELVDRNREAIGLVTRRIRARGELRDFSRERQPLGGPAQKPALEDREPLVAHAQKGKRHLRCVLHLVLGVDHDLVVGPDAELTEVLCDLLGRLQKDAAVSDSRTQAFLRQVHGAG